MHQGGATVMVMATQTNKMIFQATQMNGETVTEMAGEIIAMNSTDPEVDDGDGYSDQQNDDAFPNETQMN